jgi:linoleoyl-CoA desaturase
MPLVTFNNSNQTFYPAVKKAVETYFKDHNLKPTGNWRLYLKTVLGLLVAFSVYFFLLFGSYPILEGALLSVLFGFALVFIAFNTMHDACHDAYSRKKWVNKLMGYTMNGLGSNAFLWKIKHNILHHTYTNVEGIDDDIARHPVLRFCTSQKKHAHHRFQFIYMFFLYSMMTFIWMMVFDFHKYFSRKINNTPINKISLNDHVIFWISKASYVLFYVIIPIVCVGYQAWIIGFILMHITLGLCLSIVFQLAHVVEKTSFESVGDNAKIIETSWAEHEVKTTANFAPGNKIISFLCGGLNFQIEHHLFPRVSHIHYPSISKIVKEQCTIYAIPYNYYPSMYDAIKSHVRTMKKLGAVN